jgi:RNA polymerase sigma-70 factor (ECF subfamily)
VKEKELVLLAKSGDKDAFCKLYGLVKDKLYRYAFYHLGNRHDAEDAVSDCVVSAYQQIVNLKNPHAFYSWIFRILHVSCLPYINLQAQQRKTENLEHCKTLQTNETHGIEIREALEQLKKDEQEIVLLAVIAGLKSKEIAKITGMTAGSVRSKLSRSLAKMRIFLEESK